MAYQLQAMLAIRAMRQDRTQSELAGARILRAKAQKDRDEKQDSSDKFEETKEPRRDEVYKTVIGRVVKMDELDLVRGAVNRIDEESILLKEAVRQAEKVLEEKEEAAEQARVRFVAATKDLTKIEEHRKVWLEEEHKREEMRSDQELEEFTGKKNIDDDDNSDN